MGCLSIGCGYGFDCGFTVFFVGWLSYLCLGLILLVGFG